VDDVAVIRLEQIYPFPWRRLSEVAEQYAGDPEVCWVQEEPQNRGAWTFVSERLREIWDRVPLRYIGRLPSASPATGSLRRHREQQARIVEQAFQGSRPRR
jgi:2-oxoglutarate dehydrogenase E1 component